MKYLSLFSGIGGFELGIQLAHESNTEHASLGAESEQEKRAQRGERATNFDGVQLHTRDRTAPLCIGFSEIDKYATQIYQKHFPEHKNYGDITKIIAEDLPDFDLLCGGFPCQSFSIAGKRGGFSDTRGTMFFEIARILKAKQPRLLLLENVKGLLSHDEGRTFATIITALDELGYDCQWQVLNSKDFYVPQNRERVFIVGHLRGTRRPEVFPFGENGEVPAERPRQISPTVTSRYFKQGQSDPYVFNDSTPSIRKLTPVECERLQGFSDGWTAKGIEWAFTRVSALSYPTVISDTQRYKTLGNAVTVNVIKAITQKLI